MSDSQTSLFTWAAQQRCNAAAPRRQNPCRVDAEPPPEALAIRDVLADRRGRERAITAPRIAAAAGLWPDHRDADRGTKARQIIRTWYEHMALDRYVLIASSAGFYYTDDPEEMAHYDATQRSRIREIAITLRRTRLQARTSANLIHHGRGRWTSA